MSISDEKMEEILNNFEQTLESFDSTEEKVEYLQGLGFQVKTSDEENK